MKHHLIFFLLLPILITGCASTMRMEKTVLQRADFDLDCEKESLTLKELDHRTYGVSGCGKRATYVVEGVCLPGDRCQAIMNSDLKNEK